MEVSPKFIEIREQGRPRERKAATGLGLGNYAVIIPESIKRVLYFHNGIIDGGDLGGLSEAMDNLDTYDLDGGTL